MKRQNIPVRAPRAIHAAFKATARARGETMAAYLSWLSTPERLQELLDGAHTGSTYLSPRTDDAERVKAAARVLGCRQWDAWLALHRLAATETEDEERS